MNLTVLLERGSLLVSLMAPLGTFNRGFGSQLAQNQPLCRWPGDRVESEGGTRIGFRKVGFYMWILLNIREQ